MLGKVRKLSRAWIIVVFNLSVVFVVRLPSCPSVVYNLFCCSLLYIFTRFFAGGVKLIIQLLDLTTVC